MVLNLISVYDSKAVWIRIDSQRNVQVSPIVGDSHAIGRFADEDGVFNLRSFGIDY